LKVLVTGGAGFIGSNLVDALIERGDDVVVVDNLTTGRRSNIEPALSKGAKLVVEDIREGKMMAALLDREKPEVVFHLAAQIDVRVSTAQPDFDAGINVVGTINMLEAARLAGTKRFLYASTGGAIYGETDIVPTPEDTLIEPEAPYGQAKFAGEGYLGLWKRMHGLSTVSLRFGNVYGPRQDPLGEAGVIAIFCGKLETGGQPLVFGDGRQTRDYVYVEDVVRACMLAAGSDVNGSFNVGRGEEVSVLDLVDALRDLGSELGMLHSGRTFEPQFAPARLGEVQRSALDPTRSREELHFSAEVELTEGLRRTLQFVAQAQAAA
jgi:UDP-glucose 4-epimerase